MMENPTDLQSFVDIIEKEYGSRDAYRYLVEDQVVSKSFRELARDVRAVASWLVKNGHCGRHIAIIGGTSYPWVTVFLGILCSGNVVVPVDKMLPEQEIRNILRMGDVELVFAAEEFAHLSEGSICFGSEAYVRILQTDRVLLPKSDPEAMAEILFTSGTTGVSKGVMLSQKNLCANLKEYHRMNILEGTSCDPVAMSVLPIHHTYELTIGHLGMLYLGLTVCINDRLENIAANMNRFRPGFILVVPAIAEAFYKKIKDGISAGGSQKKIEIAGRLCGFLEKMGIDARRQLFKSLLNKFGGNLTTIVVGGAALRMEVAETFTGFGINMLQGYGLTECAPLVASNCPAANKLGSVGKPVQCMEVRIEQGEILVRGDCVMLGYYKNPEATAEAITRDGWFHTGDLGHLDEEGYLYITGRCKNLIILDNGKNIYPEELEEKLLTIDGVRDVMVYERSGQLCAAIHPADIHDGASLQRIREAMKTFNGEMPSYKRIVAFDFIAREFPKTTTMKIKRRESMQMIEEVIRRNRTEHIPPTTAMQKRIVAAFEEVLGLTGIGIGDDFFDLGGDSLASLEAALILDIQAQSIYEHPTARLLEQHLASGRENGAAADEVDVNALIRRNAGLDSDGEPKCVLLTGATGFLGAHILRELNRREVQVVCLVRSCEKLKRVLEFYFPKEHPGFRYSVVEGDIEKPGFGLSDESYQKLVDSVDMVIHTAANVSHAGHYEEFARTNVTGTEHVIAFCQDAGAILQHTSTASVSGSGTVEQTCHGAEFDEFCLDIGQKYTQNVYIHSKYEAEKAVLLARTQGLRANIFRIGNLTWRMSDGKFQINPDKNGFVQRCRGLFKVKAYGDRLADYPLDFTPVDECADAFVRLCLHPKVNNIYHLMNPHTCTMEVLCRRFLIRLEKLPQAAFEKRLRSRKEDAEVAVLAFYSSIASLSENVPTSTAFTVAELKKLGFHWSKIGFGYLRYLKKIP